MNPQVGIHHALLGMGGHACAAHRVVDVAHVGLPARAEIEAVVPMDVAKVPGLPLGMKEVQETGEGVAFWLTPPLVNYSLRHTQSVALGGEEDAALRVGCCSLSM